MKVTKDNIAEVRDALIMEVCYINCPEVKDDTCHDHDCIVWKWLGECSGMENG